MGGREKKVQLKKTFLGGGGGVKQNDTWEYVGRVGERGFLSSTFNQLYGRREVTLCWVKY